MAAQVPARDGTEDLAMDRHPLEPIFRIPASEAPLAGHPLGGDGQGLSMNRPATAEMLHDSLAIGQLEEGGSYGGSRGGAARAQTAARDAGRKGIGPISLAILFSRWKRASLCV